LLLLQQPASDRSGVCEKDCETTIMTFMRHCDETREEGLTLEMPRSVLRCCWRGCVAPLQ
jgi:hypothetical protein